MSELTFNNVLSGITLALSSAFPYAQVFGKAIPQQLSPGDFNVIPVSVRPVEKLGSRRKYNTVFDVIYYPLEDDESEDCLRVATDLPLVLETITTPQGSKIHCVNDLEINIVDGVFHCLVHYSYFVFENRVTVNDDGSTADNGKDKMYILEYPEKEI